jgi:hypothetical protein
VVWKAADGYISLPGSLVCLQEPLRRPYSAFSEASATLVAKRPTPYANRILGARLVSDSGAHYVPPMLALDTPLPVLAMVEETKETFAGQLVGQELTIRSSRGSLCRGRLRLGEMGYGAAHFACSDGRYGNLTVHMRGSLGTAYGTFDGRRITLTVG